METKFKKILSIIDRVAESADTLFHEQGNISPEERQLFEEWSGSSLGSIREILSPEFAKRQIASDPFVDGEGAEQFTLVFSEFDQGLCPDISYSIEETAYGQILIVSTGTGVCYLVFFSGTENRIPLILQQEFPGSRISREESPHQRSALKYLRGDTGQEVSIAIKAGSRNFKIWKTLAMVPEGKLISYGTLARATGHMAQEIGTAMGDNRLAMLIPCHRVVKATGELGHYHWGAKRKRAMIIREATVL